jgi:Ran GTPase-activating protein (RanGAP) involved in mRNA processing and transport
MKAKVILPKYIETTQKDNTKPLEQIVKYLEEDINDEELNLIFPGNDIYSFNTRILDEHLNSIYGSFMLNVTKINYINLSYNRISDKGIGHLTKLIEYAENLQELNLKCNEIGDIGCEKLAGALKGKIFFSHLNLNNNVIGNAGVMFINELLYTNVNLTNLDLGNNRYDWEGLIGITTALGKYNTTLEVLNVDDPAYKNPDQDFFTHFGKMFLTNTGLRKISMKLHKLRFEGMNILTHHLMLNKYLQVLDLSCNQICFQGVKYLSDYLTVARSLQSLNLSSNRIHDPGAKLLAQGIYNNKSLVHLNVTSNDIQNDGLCRLAEGLQLNQTIKSFKVFWNNTFGDESIELFKQILDSKMLAFYPDFTIYEDVTGELNIAYLETHIPEEEKYLV